MDVFALLRSAGVRSTLIRSGRPDNDPPSDGFATVLDAHPQPDDTTPGDALLRVLPPASDSTLLWIDIDRLLPPWDVPTDIFEAYIEHLLEDADPDEEPPSPVVEPFVPTDDDSRELLHTSFATAVTALDADLGRTFAKLKETGWGDTVWLLTSDAGFPLGEHGVAGGDSVNVEGVHIPLVVRLPNEAEAGRRVAAFTQPADLMPTLLTLFGVQPPPTLDGFDLRALWDGTGDRVRDAVVSVTGDGEAIRTADWALIGEQLFAQPDDHWEATDLRSRNVETAEGLESLRQTIRTPTAIPSAE